MKRVFNAVTWMLMMVTFVLLAHTFWLNAENARMIDEIKQEIQASETKHLTSEKHAFERIKQILEK